MSDDIKKLIRAQQTLNQQRRRPSRQPYPINENPNPRPPAPVGARPAAPARPKTPARKPGLTLKQMLNATTRFFPSRIETAERDNVTVTNMRRRANVIECETLTYNGTKKVPEIRKHKQLVRKRAVDASDPNLKLPFGRATVHVSCNCEDHTFTFEYALAERDAAKMTYSNGEFPIIKNPKLVPGLCKHLYVVAQKLFEKGA